MKNAFMKLCAMLLPALLLPALLLPTLLLLVPDPAQAGAITVVNPSFETLAAGSFQVVGSLGSENLNLGIPGWDTAGTAGQWQPLTVLSLDDGATIAFTNGATISQTVDPTVLEGDVYTLTVDIGDRTDQPFGGGADLLVNGNRYSATGTPNLGGWSTYTATYTGLAADVGDAITIELTIPNGSPQADFDNVHLSDSGVSTAPEPGTLLVGGFWLLGLGFFRRRSA